MSFPSVICPLLHSLKSGSQARRGSLPCPACGPGDGRRCGDRIGPRGKIGLATICSIIVNGVLLKAGIAVETRFGGILQIKGGRPLRFLELISYSGSSLNPSEVFIQGRMTKVGGAVKGEGIILANFREVPAPCHREAEQLIQELKKAGIDGALAMWGPNEAVCEIPVAVGRVGLVLPGGLNPVAAAVEAGIEAENQAMATPSWTTPTCGASGTSCPLLEPSPGPGPWVIPEEEPYIPILRFNDRRVVEVRELPAGFFSGRLSSNPALRAVREFYRRLDDGDPKYSGIPD